MLAAASCISRFPALDRILFSCTYVYLVLFCTVPAVQACGPGAVGQTMQSNGRLSHLDLHKHIYDVCTVTKLSNNSFLRRGPGYEETCDCECFWVKIIKIKKPYKALSLRWQKLSSVFWIVFIEPIT